MGIFYPNNQAYPRIFNLQLYHPTDQWQRVANALLHQLKFYPHREIYNIAKRKRMIAKLRYDIEIVGRKFVENRNVVQQRFMLRIIRKSLTNKQVRP